MNFNIRTLIKSGIYFIFLLYAFPADAQVSLVRNLIIKIEGYQNFSYESVNRRKEITTFDTITTYGKELFLKVPGDKPFGYFFRLEGQESNSMYHRVDLYDGKDLRYLSLTDSTFHTQRQPAPYRYTTLLGGLNFVKDLLGKHPSSSVIKVNDTTINGHINTHLAITISDTMINNEHLYSRRQVFVDKGSGLPALIIIEGRSKGFFDANVIDYYYDETRYANYKLNQKGITISSFTTPKTFHPPLKNVEPVRLLTPGTIAPDWILSDANNKKMSLNDMRGKVVLLDFYFIGCAGCMLSLKPLNSIYEKYKDQGFEIASITQRDKQQAVLLFEKKYHIKYPGYINAIDVVKSYHVIAAPTFYLIDQDGKIAKAFTGYSDDFEPKITAMIASLIKK